MRRVGLPGVPAQQCCHCQWQLESAGAGCKYGGSAIVAERGADGGGPSWPTSVAIIWLRFVSRCIIGMYVYCATPAKPGSVRAPVNVAGSAGGNTATLK